MSRGVLLLWGLLLTLGCATAASDPGLGAFSVLPRGLEPTVRLARASPADLAVRSVSGRAVQVDAFSHLLVLAGIDDFLALPPEGMDLSPRDAARLLSVLLRKPVTLGAFAPRLTASHLLREVLAGGTVSREELLRRVERFKVMAVLRPDGCLAWALDGRTQQRAGPVRWTEAGFFAGPFELGRFYSGFGGVFRLMDERLRPSGDGRPLADVHDDADLLNRSLDGAEEAFVELYHALGQLLSRPADSLAALRHLPQGLVALIASSPEYLERFRFMTRGEQQKALSKLLTQLLATFGAAGGTTSTLTRAFVGAEAVVPVLSLSSEGMLVLERVAVPVGQVATVLGGGPGAAIILQQINGAGQNTAPPAGPGQWAPAEESMSAQSRAYQEWISGRSADDAYWVGGVGRKSGGVKFDGFKDGVLLEAKGPGYANKFLDNLNPKRWFKNSGARDLVSQAKRQSDAAQGVPIRWHIAEQKTAEAIQKLLEGEGVSGIDIVYTPFL